MASEIGQADQWDKQKREEIETRGAFHAVIKELHQQKSTGNLDENLANTHLSFEVIERNDNGLPIRDINLVTPKKDQPKGSCVEYIWSFLKNYLSRSTDSVQNQYKF